MISARISPNCFCVSVAIKAGPMIGWNPHVRRVAAAVDGVDAQVDLHDTREEIGSFEVAAD